MKNKIYSLFLFCTALMVGQNANAQCTGGRYLTEVFPNVTKTTVTYSSVYNLQMDIFQPTGDTYTQRPLIILAHGGSFVSGDRTNDVTVTQLCNNFAKRGYVTVSIDYRLGSAIQLVLDSSYAIDEVIKAISDGKAAIRYFMQDAATTNTYKIDTNNIFIGGNSAGAVLYMHVGYIDSMGECPGYIQTAMNNNGGFEGNSGNAGYTTKSKAIINLAGALNETSFVGPGNKPSANAQGTLDSTVPYYCYYPLNGSVHVNLCGLGSLEPVYVANSINHVNTIFPGDGHVPWSSDASKFNTVDTMIINFLYSLVCGSTSVNEVANNSEIVLYPNPAKELLHVSAPQAISGITVYDMTGRVVILNEGIHANTYEVNTTTLSKGMYFVRMNMGSGKDIIPVVKRIVIE
ncbi:MAG: T9SS type A sorting domain-containing protein [Bacteroidota bacterium]